MTNLYNRFQQYIEQNSLFTAQDKILLTVSGGVDSMVMLDLFAKGGYNVGIAHCNFQLRSKESDEDELLVERVAASHSMEFYNRRFDTIGEMEATGDSMEMVARRQRYAWFEQLRIEHNYTVIAIAHHIDDSIETFFINLLRGTGLKGLTGISPQIGKVVRPLMFATRKEILEYAVAKKIHFREDSSNRSTKYLRNKIRLGLIPRIKDISVKFTPLMRQNIDRLTEAQIFISNTIAKIQAEIMTLNEGIYHLDIEKIDPTLPTNFVVYEILNTNFGFKGDVVEALLSSSQSASSGKRFYSKNYVAYTDRGQILISTIPSNDLCEVEVAQRSHRSYCGNSVLYYERLDIGILDSFIVPDNVALLDLDTLKYPLTLRRWREGDWFIPFGMNGRKKVSDFLIDEKVSLPEKERQFVLVSGNDIVWIVGHRIDDRFKIRRESENILKITKDII